MKKLRIVRLEQSDEGALGVLLIEGDIFCVTLEPDVSDPSKFQIPEGTYQIKRFHGHKWKDTFEVPVAGHTAILFHAGNVEAETEGCILLGKSAGSLRMSRAILNSGNTFRAFMQIMKDEERAVLEILHLY